MPNDLIPSQALARMRAANPLVQCITNFVAMNFAANTMLAAGASPAMVHAAEESADFAGIARATTINIGTLTPPWVTGMERAIAGATAAGNPWVFDPVAHFATPYRAKVAQDLLALSPTILRGNASEILALNGQSSAGQGVDAGDPVAAAEDAARQLAGRTGGAVVVTGPVDFATDGTSTVRVHGGSPLMPQVTATGCALTCLMGAFAASEDTPLDAAVAALSLFSAAGSKAAHSANGPGSFAWQFLDALAATDGPAIDAVRLERL